MTPPETRPLTGWQLLRLLFRLGSGNRVAESIDSLHQHQAWPALIELAKHTDVLPALASMVAANPDLTQTVTVALREEMHQALVANTQNNMEILAQASKIARTLNRSRIIPLFLKGTADLLQERAPCIGFRPQSDIDIMVEPCHLEAACHDLLTDGYRFYPFDSQPKFNSDYLHADVQRALLHSKHHHHLTPLIKEGYGASVELHKHHLTKRFQAQNSVDTLYASSLPMAYHGAQFRVPSVEQQISQYVLSHFVHDGYLARFEFPVKTAVDCWRLKLEAAQNRVPIDRDLLLQQCNGYYSLLEQLAQSLLYNPDEQGQHGTLKLSVYAQLMERRANSPMTSKLLNSQARMRHLISMACHNPEKLSGYLSARSSR